MTKIRRKPLIITVPDEKIAYVNSPLNGCTTIKNIFFDYINYEVEDPTLIHSKVREPDKLSVFRSLGDVPKDFFRFSVVRNPYDRLVSFYEAKWSAPEGQEPLLWDFYKPYNPQLEFTEFTMWLSNLGVSNVEFHAMTQYDNLLIDKMDYVVRFENFESSLRTALVEMGGMKDIDIPQYGSKPRKDDYREYYDEKSKRVVGDLYKIDLENLGYSF